MTDKVIVDGKVAVLVSHGFGGGWSTWENDGTALLFDPVIVGILEDENGSYEEIEKYLTKKYPEVYSGGIDGLTVEWVPQGARFRIEEYDGDETLILESDMKWHTA